MYEREFSRYSRNNRKIFFIGLNKTGTTSLHLLCLKSGLSSFHWKKDNPERYLAVKVFNNYSAGFPILRGVDEFNAYSEFTFSTVNQYLDATKMFRALHREYPDSYFVLNTRDRSKWVQSRANHFSRRDGPLISRHTACFGLSEAEIRLVWQQQFDDHHHDVRDYFSKKRGRFLEFDIEHDPIEKLCEFVRRDYTLDPTQWKKTNESERHVRSKRRHQKAAAI